MAKKKQDDTMQPAAPVHVISADEEGGMEEILAVWRHWQQADPDYARKFEPIVREFELYTSQRG